MVESTSRPNPDRQWKRHGRFDNPSFVYGRPGNPSFVRNYHDNIDGVTVIEGLEIAGGFRHTRIEDIGGGWNRQITNRRISEKIPAEIVHSYHLYVNDSYDNDNVVIRQTIDYSPFSEGAALINSVEIPHIDEELPEVYSGFRVRYDNNGKLIDFAIRVHEPENDPSYDGKNILFSNSLREIGGYLRAGLKHEILVPHEGEDMYLDPDHDLFVSIEDTGLQAFYGIVTNMLDDLLPQEKIEKFAQELYGYAMVEARRDGVVIPKNEVLTLEDFVASKGVNKLLIPYLNQKTFEVLTDIEAFKDVGNVYEIVFKQSSENPNHVVRSIYPESRRDTLYSRVNALLGRADIYRFHMYGIEIKDGNYIVHFQNLADGLSEKSHVVTFPADLSVDMPNIQAAITTKDHTDWQIAVPLVPLHYEVEVS